MRVYQITLWRRFLVERAYTVDDLSRPISILIDSGGCRTGPIKIRRFVCELLNAAVGTGDGGRDHDWDGVQTIIQITAKLTPEIQVNEIPIRCCREPNVHFVGSTACESAMPACASRKTL